MHFEGHYLKGKVQPSKLYSRLQVNKRKIKIHFCSANSCRGLRACGISDRLRLRKKKPLWPTALTADEIWFSDFDNAERFEIIFWNIPHGLNRNYDITVLKLHHFTSRSMYSWTRIRNESIRISNLLQTILTGYFMIFLTHQCLL